MGVLLNSSYCLGAQYTARQLGTMIEDHDLIQRGTMWQSIPKWVSSNALLERTKHPFWNGTKQITDICHTNLMQLSRFLCEANL